MATSKWRGPFNDDDCFYHHFWTNNVVIALGTLSPFYCANKWLFRLRDEKWICWREEQTNASKKAIWRDQIPVHCFDWRCFYCSERNSLVALLEALCARKYIVLDVDFWNGNDSYFKCYPGIINFSLNSFWLQILTPQILCTLWNV
jgi:muconolactone delta-isomerase